MTGIRSGSGCPACADAKSMRINVGFNNFGQPHFAACSVPNVALPPLYRQLFLSSAGVTQLLESSIVRAAAEADADCACADFNAARVLGCTSEKCNTSAVGSTMCCLSQVAHMLNIATGKRHICLHRMLCCMLIGRAGWEQCHALCSESKGHTALLPT